MSHQIYRPLHCVGRLRTSSTTIGIRGRFIREDDVSTQVYYWNVIRSAGHGKTKGNHDHVGKDLAIRSEIGDPMYLQASYLTFFGSSNFDIVNLITTMDSRSKILAAVLNPLNGTTRFHGGESRTHLFGIDIEFGAKAATDFWYNHTYLVLRQTNESSQDITQKVGNLRGTPDGQIFTCLAVLRYDTACLHRDWGKSLVNQAGFDNDTAIGLCLCENFVNFIGRGMHAEAHIFAKLFIQNRRIRLHSF